MSNEYVSPFSLRYASKEMAYIFSSNYRTLTFRKLWIALAKGEKEMGLPILESQIAAMEKCSHEIDHSKIASYEKKFRHDIMAHIHAFGDLCPKAKGIIHLGATSTFVTDNGDLIQMKEALQLLLSKLVRVLKLLSDFCLKYAKSPCVGYTHFQSAQPTTIGKRGALWLQDFLWDAQELKRLIELLPFLGAKGATGTQNSFLLLFKGDEAKVKKLESFLAKTFGFTKVLPLAGQTYSRKIDLAIVNALASFAASAHKMATDIRLLAHVGEICEGFEKDQVGSSAMPYKRNPIHAERICGIARFVMSLSQNPAYTLATQWLERSLDDSSNKRLSMPEAFLGTDAVCDLVLHLVSTLAVNEKLALRRMEEQMPLFLMENILMACSEKGGDRQQIHEHLRKISDAAQKEKEPLKAAMRAMEKDNKFPFTKKELENLCSTRAMIGRAESQVKEFVKAEVHPFASKRLNKN